MTLLASFNRTGSLSREREENYGRDHSLNYLLAFGSLGLFVSMMRSRSALTASVVSHAGALSLLRPQQHVTFAAERQLDCAGIAEIGLR